jgi:hypothetical protein
MPPMREGSPWFANKIKRPQAQAAPPRAGMGDLKRLESAQAGRGIPLQNRGSVIDWTKMGGGPGSQLPPPQQRQVFSPVQGGPSLPRPQMPEPATARQGVMQGMGGLGDLARRIPATANELIPGIWGSPGAGAGDMAARRAFELGGAYPSQAQPLFRAPWWWKQYVYPGGGGGY